MTILQDLLAMRSTPPEEQLVEDNLDPAEVSEMASELQDLHTKMLHIMEEVRDLVKEIPRSFKGSAEAYWIPHIMIALGGEHEWMTAGHESTMKKTIDEMNEYADGGPASGPDGDDDEDDGGHEYR